MTEQELSYAVKVNDRDLIDLVKRIDAVNIALGPDTKKAVEVADQAIRAHTGTVVTTTERRRALLRAEMEDYKQIASQAKRGSETQIAASIEAAKAARKLGIDVHEVGLQYNHLGQNIKHFDREASQGFRGALAGSGVLKGLGRSAAYAGGFFIGAASLSLAVRSSWDELQTLNKEAGLAQAALKSTGDVAGTSAKQIVAFADAESRKTTNDKASIEAAEVQLLRFTQVRNELGRGNDIYTQASKSSLDLATKTGDAASAALILGKALNDPLRGMTQLRRVGVGFTQEQEAQVKALMQAGNIMGAQKIILGQVAIAYGGAADAAGNKLGGQLTILKHEATDLGATFLADLQPQIRSIVTDLRHWIENTTDTAAGQRRLKNDAKELATGVKDLIEITRTFMHVANDAADAVGGWKHLVELLIALKATLWVTRLSLAIKELIGVEGVSGLLGAKGAAGGLLSKLTLLKGLGVIGITVVIDKIIKDVTGTDVLNYDINDQSAGGPGDLLPVKRGGKWVDPMTGMPVKDQAYWNHNPPGVPAASGTDSNPNTGAKGRSGGGSAGSTNATGRKRLIDYALSMLGTPYAWGGAGPGGFDCSGLVMWALSQSGVNIPHNSVAQFSSSAGKSVSLNNLKAGDVVFGPGSDGTISKPGHEAMYIGNGMVVESPQSGKNVRTISLADWIKYAGGYSGARDFFGGGGAGGKHTPHNPSDFGTGVDMKAIRLRIAELRQGVAAAAGTRTKTDDQAALAKIISFLKTALQSVPKSDVKDRTTLLDELASYSGRYNALGKGKAAGLASDSSTKSFKDQLKAELAALATIAADGFGGVSAKARPKIVAMQKLLTKPVTSKELANLRVQLKEIIKQYDLSNLKTLAPKVAAGSKSGNQLLDALQWLPTDLEIPIKDAWGDVVKTISPADLIAQVKLALAALGSAKTSAAAKSALAQLKELGKEATEAISINKDGVVKAAQDAIDAANQVLSDSQSKFSTAWGNMTSKALSAFDQETQDALQSMQVLVNGPGGSFLFSQGAQTPSQLAAAQLTSSHDAAATAKQNAADQADLDAKKAYVQRLVSAGFSETTNALRQARQDEADAQQKVDDNSYTAQLASLTASGDAEQKAADTQLAQAQKNYQSERDLQREHLSNMLADLETGLEKSTITVADARTKLGKLWDAIGLDSGAAGAAMGDAFVTSLDESLNDPTNGIWPTLEAVSKAIADLAALKTITGPPKAPTSSGTKIAGVTVNPYDLARSFGGGAVKLAGGGWVRHRPGGVAATIGEGGADEVVAPEPKLRKLLREEVARAGGGAQLHIGEYHVHDSTDLALLVGKLSLLYQTRPHA